MTLSPVDFSPLSPKSEVRTGGSSGGVGWSLQTKSKDGFKGKGWREKYIAATRNNPKGH